MTRPRDLALFLLGSGDATPRQRARDQQADAAGLMLKRQILTEVVARDPEPDGLEGALLEIVDTIGPPTGPTLAIARSFLEEWRFESNSPEWMPHLLHEAITPSQKQKGSRRDGNVLP